MTNEEFEKEKKMMPSLSDDKYYNGDVRLALENLLYLSDEVGNEHLAKQVMAIHDTLKRNIKALEKQVKELSK